MTLYSICVLTKILLPNTKCITATNQYINYIPFVAVLKY